MDNLKITQIIQHLERSRDSVHQIKDLFNQRPGSSLNTHDHQDEYYYYYNKGLGDHSTAALAALNSALSLLQNPLHFSLEDCKSGNSKSNDYGGGETPRRDRRGCYKRRRNVESKVVETANLTDDGFAWRKYGQKEILQTEHPRNYYKCTHQKFEGCQAKKQVQQISENPTKYRVIYYGNHTCKSIMRTPPNFLDSTTPENPDSSVYLSFQTDTPSAKHALNPATPSNFLIPNSIAAAVVQQEHGPIKEETQSEPSDHHHHHHHHHQYNSSPSSPDPTTTTSRSVTSSGEVYYSMASPHGMGLGEDFYSHMMADSVDFEQVLQGLLSES